MPSQWMFMPLVCALWKWLPTSIPTKNVKMQQERVRNLLKFSVSGPVRTLYSAIFRKVVAGELPNAFKKVEDDKIKAIIKSCIEPKPEERITVHQLLENDFFEEKYLKVLDVGKNGNELKLRLVVNEPGVNNRRMPEDEAIDFTFHIGVDTALQVAQVCPINGK